MLTQPSQQELLCFPSPFMNVELTLMAFEEHTSDCNLQHCSTAATEGLLCDDVSVTHSASCKKQKLSTASS
jgi:hypothetical protein